jgi:hypothetical protein
MEQRFNAAFWVEQRSKYRKRDDCMEQRPNAAFWVEQRFSAAYIVSA